MVYFGPSGPFHPTSQLTLRRPFRSTATSVVQAACSDYEPVRGRALTLQEEVVDGLVVVGGGLYLSVLAMNLPQVGCKHSSGWIRTLLRLVVNLPGSQVGYQPSWYQAGCEPSWISGWLPTFLVSGWLWTFLVVRSSLLQSRIQS